MKGEIGNREGIANSLGNLGIVYSIMGDYRKAIDYLQHSLVIDKEIGNQEGIANSLGNLGKRFNRSIRRTSIQIAGTKQEKFLVTVTSADDNEASVLFEFHPEVL